MVVWEMEWIKKRWLLGSVRQRRAAAWCKDELRGTDRGAVAQSMVHGEAHAFLHAISDKVERAGVGPGKRERLRATRKEPAPLLGRLLHTCTMQSPTCPLTAPRSRAIARVESLDEV